MKTILALALILTPAAHAASTITCMDNHEPAAKTKMIEAREKKTLIPFSRMSPSMVYLKDQEEVTLAFAEVSYAVSLLIRNHGSRVYVDFLRLLSKKPFKDAFAKSFGQSTADFERSWQVQLEKER